MSYVNSVTVYPSSATITKGKWYYGAYASIASDCPECAEVEWYSNSPSIASVNKTTGYIYGVSTGTTRIYAEATDGSGKKDYITVTVTPPVSVTGVSVCPTSKTMNVGDTDYLCETVYPSNATNQTVTWCSSDESVATVNTYTGLVRAKKAGIVTITACTVDGEYSASCTVKVFIDTVTIQKDGAFNKVVFNNSGKVWYCLNHDLIYDVVDELRSTLTTRLMHNYCTKYVEGEPWNTDKTPKEYTDDEIRLLYAIDPYGVAAYVQKYAGEKDGGLETTLQEKDRVFELLFGRQPKYFDRTISGNWYETTDKSNLSSVISESEEIFGMHPIYDELTILNLCGFALDIAGIVFNTSFFATGTIRACIGKLGKTIVRVLSVGEALVKNELVSYTANSIIESAFEKTKLEWAYNFVSLYDDLNEIADSIVAEPNYCNEILNYCAHDTGYSVYVELRNGTKYKIDDICTAINN